MVKSCIKLFFISAHKAPCLALVELEKFLQDWKATYFKILINILPW